jgi:hypothetical protein
VRPDHRAALLGAALLALAGAARAQQTGAPNPHARLYGRACTDCHTTSRWRDVRFDHARTAFRLLGQHRSVPCAGCHDLRDFRGAAAACATCHADPHRGDAGPRCEQCHSETSWHEVGAQNAHARTRLPDLGVHAALRCEDCHRQTGAQQFTGRVTPCVACHQTTYDHTTSPSHATLGIPEQCETCHQFTSWAFARFPSHDAVFPIYAGAHAGAWRTCADCHPDPGSYQVFDCTGCHTQPRTDPRHQGIPGYQWQSQACLACHPAGRHADARFHEAIFPINGGTHAGTWTACADCHTDPSNYATFSCMTGACHPQPATDPPHSGVPGYQYVAAQCLSCHPDGRAGSFAQHDAIFPINSGTHAGRWTACSDCHTDPANRQVFSCMTGACHPQNPTDGTHQGIPGYAYTAAQCLSCHPTGVAGTFTAHDQLFFPIYSGSHAGRWSDCAACHTDAGTRATFTCMSGNCHPPTETNGHHQGVNGYQYLAAQCYACHPNGRSGGTAPFRVPTVPRRPPASMPLAAARPQPLSAIVRSYVARWAAGGPTAR